MSQIGGDDHQRWLLRGGDGDGDSGGHDSDTGHEGPGDGGGHGRSTC